MRKICVIKRMPTRYEMEARKRVIYLEEPIAVMILLLVSFILVG